MAADELTPIKDEEEEPEVEEAPKAAGPRKLSRKDIIATTEDAMIRNGLRRPHEVYQFVAEKMQLTPKAGQSVKPIVQAHYEEIVKKLVCAMVRTMLKEGTEDFKTISTRIRTEKYNVEDTLIIELIRDEKKSIRESASQRVKDRLQQSQEQQKKLDDPEKRVAAVALYKENLRQSVSETVLKQRNKDIETLRKIYALKYLRETEQNEQRIMIHHGAYRGREVFVKTVFKDTDSEEVDNVHLLFRRVSGAKKMTINFDIRKLQERWTGEQGMDTCKKNLATLNKVLDFKDIPMMLSFLLHVLDNAEDLPRTTSRIVDSMFYPYLRSVENEIILEFVNEIVEKKYYQMSQNLTK